LRKRGWLLMAALGFTGLAALATASVCLLSGCGTIGYYAQAVSGHLDILSRAKPVAQLVQAPAAAPSAAASAPQGSGVPNAATAGTAEGKPITPALQERLRLSQRMRDFAVSELKLPDNDSYRRYADLGRPAVVWNVVAAPELSLNLKTWCFAVVGCVGYRGYFDRTEADALAEQLKKEGLEVSVYGVPAYSTLGRASWLGGDPLLNTFIGWTEGDLARLIFHELTHQIAYADDDTTFNESFAGAVERIGGERWLALHASPATRAADATASVRREQFRSLTLRSREALAALYAGAMPEPEKRQRKAELMAGLRAEYQQLKTASWGGYNGYDDWFARANNAAFGIQASYNELIPQFERLFEAEGRDFARFYETVRGLAAMPKAQRRAKLAAY
jgi:predicted aminopeptidase